MSAPNTVIPREFSKTKAEMEKRKAMRAKNKKVEDEDTATDITFEEHTWSIEKCLQHHQSDQKSGLSDVEAQKRLEIHGLNELTPPKARHPCLLFMDHLTGFFSLLLWLAGVMCFVAYGLDQEQADYLYLGIVLVIVVTLTGIFSWYQDAKSAAVMAGFSRFLPEKTIVVRGGVELNVDANTLVPGDIIRIKSGEKIPADFRVLEAHDFKVDNASLTGESDAQVRTPKTDDKDCLPLEAGNMAFYGTLCLEGSARGLVISTGEGTVIGKIACLASGTEQTDTPIAQEIEHFIHIISAIAIILGISFFLVGVGKGVDFIANLVFCIGIIVANVPEGLLATVTVSLTLTAQRMALKKVLVKNLEAVETLGSTSVIASDKTGTLTQNIMTVEHLWYDGSIHFAAHGGAKGSYEVKDDTFQKLYQCMCLCTTATFVNDEKNMAMPVQGRECNGDASESAFIKFAEQVSPFMAVREANPMVFAVPFNSANKYMVHICQQEKDWSKSRLLFLKGAPERVWNRCDTVMVNGKPEPKENYVDEYNKAQRTMMGNGERVLGCAYIELDPEEFPKDYEFNGKDYNFPMERLVFLGLVALIDPPRTAVPRAVLSCQKAGIQVIMVTGDHPDTAEAIAKKVHIIRSPTIRDIAREKGVEVKELKDDPAVENLDAIVITGSQLLTMSPEQLDLALDKDQIVFARTSPKQKLTIVQGLQKKQRIHTGPRAGKLVKHVVAVTGDGVNDSPALKAADIGVAMGIVGSDVAKDAADMILLNDNFANIVQGVEEGRLIFDNLKKSIAYTLSSNIPEITPFLVYIIAQIPLPLPTILILCIDLGTDLVPAISLAYETKEANIMEKPPRDMLSDRLVTTKLVSFSYLQIGVVQALAGFFCYFTVMADYGFHSSSLPGLAETFEKYKLDNYKVAFFDAATSMWLSPAYHTAWTNEGGCFHSNQQILNGGYSNTAITDAQRVTATHMVYIDDCDPVELRECNYKTHDVCHEPEEALMYAQTSFFVSIVIVQWADILACKTRTLSIGSQGMGNTMLNFGLFFETLLAAVLCYLGPLNSGLGTRPIRFVHWLPALPFAMIIVTYDEIRKFLLRNLGKGNWIEEFTYY